MKISDNMIEKPHTLVYDGEESKYYNFKVLSKFPVREFKYLQHLFSVLDTSSFNKVLREVGGHKLEFMETYVSSHSGLDVQYIFDESANDIVVISTGEKQPGRFQVYLDAVFKVT